MLHRDGSLRCHHCGHAEPEPAECPACRSVELAAVVDADTGLGLPDFRAEERTFQLVTQLAGRSGRDAPGRVLVQTFQPDARPLALAANHDVRRFLADELVRRRELGYPPFRHLVRVVATGPDERGPSALLEELKAGLGDRKSVV